MSKTNKNLASITVAVDDKTKQLIQNKGLKKDFRKRKSTTTIFSEQKAKNSFEYLIEHENEFLSSKITEESLVRNQEVFNAFFYINLHLRENCNLRVDILRDLYSKHLDEATIKIKLKQHEFYAQFKIFNSFKQVAQVCPNLIAKCLKFLSKCKHFCYKYRFLEEYKDNHQFKYVEQRSIFHSFSTKPLSWETFQIAFKEYYKFLNKLNYKKSSNEYEFTYETFYQTIFLFQILDILSKMMEFFFEIKYYNGINFNEFFKAGCLDSLLDFFLNDAYLKNGHVRNEIDAKLIDIISKFLFLRFILTSKTETLRVFEHQNFNIDLKTKVEKILKKQDEIKKILDAKKSRPNKETKNEDEDDYEYKYESMNVNWNFFTRLLNQYLYDNNLSITKSLESIVSDFYKSELTLMENYECYESLFKHFKLLAFSIVYGEFYNFDLFYAIQDAYSAPNEEKLIEFIFKALRYLLTSYVDKMDSKVYKQTNRKPIDFYELIFDSPQKLIYLDEFSRTVPNKNDTLNERCLFMIDYFIYILTQLAMSRDVNYRKFLFNYDNQIGLVNLINEFVKRKDFVFSCKSNISIYSANLDQDCETGELKFTCSRDKNERKSSSLLGDLNNLKILFYKNDDISTQRKLKNMSNSRLLKIVENIVNEKTQAKYWSIENEETYEFYFFDNIEHGFYWKAYLLFPLIDLARFFAKSIKHFSNVCQDFDYKNTNLFSLNVKDDEDYYDIKNYENYDFIQNRIDLNMRRMAIFKYIVHHLSSRSTNAKFNLAFIQNDGLKNLKQILAKNKDIGLGLTYIIERLEKQIVKKETNPGNKQLNGNEYNTNQVVKIKDEKKIENYLNRKNTFYFYNTYLDYLNTDLNEQKVSLVTQAKQINETIYELSYSIFKFKSKRLRFYEFFLVESNKQIMSLFIANTLQIIARNKELLKTFDYSVNSIDENEDACDNYYELVGDFKRFEKLNENEKSSFCLYFISNFLSSTTWFNMKEKRIDYCYDYGRLFMNYFLNYSNKTYYFNMRMIKATNSKQYYTIEAFLYNNFYQRSLLINRKNLSINFSNGVLGNNTSFLQAVANLLSNKDLVNNSQFEKIVVDFIFILFNLSRATSATKTDSTASNWLEPSCVSLRNSLNSISAKTTWYAVEGLSVEVQKQIDEIVFNSLSTFSQEPAKVKSVDLAFEILINSFSKKNSSIIKENHSLLLGHFELFIYLFKMCQLDLIDWNYLISKYNLAELFAEILKLYYNQIDFNKDFIDYNENKNNNLNIIIKDINKGELNTTLKPNVKTSIILDNTLLLLFSAINYYDDFFNTSISDENLKLNIHKFKTQFYQANGVEILLGLLNSTNFINSNKVDCSEEADKDKFNLIIAVLIVIRVTLDDVYFKYENNLVKNPSLEHKIDQFLRKVNSTSNENNLKYLAQLYLIDSNTKRKITKRLYLNVDRLNDSLIYLDELINKSQITHSGTNSKSNPNGVDFEKRLNEEITNLKLFKHLEVIMKSIQKGIFKWFILISFSSSLAKVFSYYLNHVVSILQNIDQNNDTTSSFEISLKPECFNIIYRQTLTYLLSIISFLIKCERHKMNDINVSKFGFKFCKYNGLSAIMNLINIKQLMQKHFSNKQYNENMDNLVSILLDLSRNEQIKKEKWQQDSLNILKSCQIKTELSLFNKINEILFNIEQIGTLDKLFESMINKCNNIDLENDEETFKILAYIYNMSDVENLIRWDLIMENFNIGKLFANLLQRFIQNNSKLISEIDFSKKLIEINEIHVSIKSFSKQERLLSLLMYILDTLRNLICFKSNTNMPWNTSHKWQSYLSMFKKNFLKNKGFHSLLELIKFTNFIKSKHMNDNRADLLLKLIQKFHLNNTSFELKPKDDLDGLIDQSLDEFNRNLDLNKKTVKNKLIKMKEKLNNRLNQNALVDYLNKLNKTFLEKKSSLKLINNNVITEQMNNFNDLTSLNIFYLNIMLKLFRLKKIDWNLLLRQDCAKLFANYLNYFKTFDLKFKDHVNILFLSYLSEAAFYLTDINVSKNDLSSLKTKLNSSFFLNNGIDAILFLLSNNSNVEQLLSKSKGRLILRNLILITRNLSLNSGNSKKNWFNLNISNKLNDFLADYKKQLNSPLSYYMSSYVTDIITNVNNLEQIPETKSRIEKEKSSLQSESRLSNRPEEWNKKQVENWLKEKKLNEKFIKVVNDGVSLKQLNDLAMQSQEFFNQSVQANQQIDNNEMDYFKKCLGELFGTNTNKLTEDRKEQHHLKRRESKEQNREKQQQSEQLKTQSQLVKHKKEPRKNEQEKEKTKICVIL